jgi:hypothetical protein
MGKILNKNEKEEKPKNHNSVVELKTEKIEKLKKERDKCIQEEIEVDKLFPTAEGDDYEFLKSLSEDLYFERRLIEQDIMELQEYGYIKSSGYTEAGITIGRWY